MTNTALIGIDIRRDLGSPEESIEAIQRDHGCTPEVARVSYWVNRLVIDLLKMSSAAFQLVQNLPKDLPPLTRVMTLVLSVAGAQSQDSADGLREVVMDLLVEGADVDEFISSIFPESD